MRKLKLNIPLAWLNKFPFFPFISGVETTKLCKKIQTVLLMVTGLMKGGKFGSKFVSMKLKFYL